MSRTLTPGDRYTPALGSLPAAWEIAPLKYATCINALKLDESTPPETEIEYIDISSVDSDGRILKTEPMRFENAPSRARRLPRDGDTLVSTVRTYLRAIAQVPTVTNGLVCSTGFAVVSPGADLDPRFLFYWLRSVPMVEEICARSVGVSYPAINPSDFSGLPVPLPPLGSQRAIADFLDRKTRAIDELIRKKERLIELLQEKRQALITQAVTKGLDPNVPMKDSGVEWPPRIPESWTMTKVKHLARIEGRIGFRGYTTNDQVDAEEGALTLGATHITPDGKIDLSAPIYLSWEKYWESPEIMVRRGDLVVVQRGSTSGKIGFVSEDLGEATINPSLILVTDLKISGKFLFYYLTSRIGRSYLDRLISATAIPMVSQEQLGNVAAAEPPPQEQVEIIAYLDSACRGVESVIGTIRAQIEKLAEYRQALISAAVTGQIDVTEEAAA